ncbi:protein translocase subunit SecD [Nocardioides marinus]|uniref:Protein translocase subunit SecD n=1 Tax=Nocardioides marinus TaxID=374514 RepID=A0A7Y9YD47_9ACTN|nr:protein translocase subunit SecD [Nocardioides marinus]NYI10005.1 preprotein translocase subunit SecD [Nocardioides marinus]
MARKTARPGRTLVVFFLAMAIAYGLVALAGTWKPTLGLDLQGGTSITLRAEGDPGEEALDQARQIIDDRVNGSGVAEAEVTTQGGNEIVVEIPGENARNLIETVQRTAQLRFRLVACSTVDGRCATSTGLPEGIQIDPSTTLPQEDGDQGEGNNRAALGSWARLSDTGSDGGKKDGNGQEQGQGTDEGAQGKGGKQSAYDACIAAAADDKTAAKPLEWIDNPTTACVDAFTEFQASGGCQQGASAAMGDDPATPLITCDEDGIAYLLSPAMIEGTSLDDAGAAIPQQQVNYVVTLSFDGEGSDVFADISNALVGTEKQFAIVLDGQVLSAPTMEGRILDGNAQISGDFTETTANSLATSLRYGSLPIAFEDQPLVETIGPSLAGDQLSAGLTAGGIGLAIVMLYCLLYYRGLGTVVIASLFVAAGITYAMVLLLSETANFTLTLPGIAGLIVAVGITADSFIVYFERIRDEMRIGKSMRVAVESGWKRARNTCLAADAVSLLAAVVLYIFAAGVVKGFAFALGLTTIIDLVVFFWFTHPMVSYLAKYRFFNKGHRLSGLSPETLGVSRVATGGNA